VESWEIFGLCFVMPPQILHFILIIERFLYIFHSVFHVFEVASVLFDLLICVYSLFYICMHIYTYIYIVFVLVSICIYVYFLCIYIYIHIYIYIYIHTYIYMYIYMYIYIFENKLNWVFFFGFLNPGSSPKSFPFLSLCRHTAGTPSTAGMVTGGVQ